MYVDAFVDIAKAGKITGMNKSIDKGRQVYAFGAGTQKLYDYLDENPQCMSAPVNYTNDIRSISALDNFISINNSIIVEIYTSGVCKRDIIPSLNIFIYWPIVQFISRIYCQSFEDIPRYIV